MKMGESKVGTGLQLVNDIICSLEGGYTFKGLKKRCFKNFCGTAVGCALITGFKFSSKLLDFHPWQLLLPRCTETVDRACFRQR